MKTRSLPLSPHEVRAALDGRLGLVVRPVIPTVKGCKVGAYYTSKGTVEPVNVQEDGDPWTDIKCPLGVPGDHLCCKEPYYIQGTHGQHRTDGLRWGSWSGLPTTISPDGKRIVYYKEGFDRCAPMWRSPATMPAWASRITLEVRGVRCVRLHQLCEDDMRKAYGISMATPASHDFYKQLHTSFEAVWDKRYAKRGPGWDQNPWAWAAEVDHLRRDRRHTPR